MKKCVFTTRGDKQQSVNSHNCIRNMDNKQFSSGICTWDWINCRMWNAPGTAGYHMTKVKDLEKRK